MTLWRKKTGMPIDDVVILKTPGEKARGLLGALTPYSVHMKTRWGIHTMGLRFPIDVLVADKALRVRAIKKNLPAGKFYFWNPFWENVFEFPAGTIEKAGIQKMDELEFRE
jgi:hypothetical protein